MDVERDDHELPRAKLAAKGPQALSKFVGLTPREYTVEIGKHKLALQVKMISPASPLLFR